MIGLFYWGSQHVSIFRPFLWSHSFFCRENLFLLPESTYTPSCQESGRGGGGWGRRLAGISLFSDFPHPCPLLALGLLSPDPVSAPHVAAHAAIHTYPSLLQNLMLPHADFCRGSAGGPSLPPAPQDRHVRCSCLGLPAVTIHSLSLTFVFFLNHFTIIMYSPFLGLCEQMPFQLF